MSEQGGRPVFSADGYYWWDGTGWQPAVSPDRRWRWDGRVWIAIGETRAPSGLPTGALVTIIASAAVVVLVVVSVMAYIGFSRVSGNQPSAVISPIATASPTSTGAAQTGPIPCDQLEHTQVHFHALLQIFNQGQAVAIPTGLGRTASCFYWLHMHNGEQGIIHVEAPADRIFTLGDFFQVWAAWAGSPQPLDSTHVSSITLTGNERLLVYRDRGDGAGPVGVPGDPKAIELRSHEIITLEIAPPMVSPPASFPSGF
jgi:hypothetical protein